MADIRATTAKCANCAQPNSDSGIKLKLCAKCHTTHYCSRECQKNDWKVHKRVCASMANSASSHTSSTPAGTGDLPPHAPPSSKGLAVTIDKPFHCLDAQTWLHDRSEQDVFKLLIDTYRFRVEDDYKFGGEVDNDSLYGGAQDGRRGFRRFLRLAEKQGRLLPLWWSREKAAECEAVGMSRGWSSLAAAVEKSDIIEHYGNPVMPMQLRMFGEQVYGSGPGGQSGASMRQIQMMAEKGEMHASVLNMASMSMS